MFERLSRELGDTDGGKKGTPYSVDICCEFLLFCCCPFAEHLILFLRCERKRKSFPPTKLEPHNTFFFFLLWEALLVCKHLPAEDSHATTGEECLLLDVDSFILGASELAL
jgi:hypothetical protein